MINYVHTPILGALLFSLSRSRAVSRPASPAASPSRTSWPTTPRPQGPVAPHEVPGGARGPGRLAVLQRVPRRGRGTRGGVLVGCRRRLAPGAQHQAVRGGLAVLPVGA